MITLCQEFKGIIYKLSIVVFLLEYFNISNKRIFINAKIKLLRFWLRKSTKALNVIIYYEY